MSTRNDEAEDEWTTVQTTSRRRGRGGRGKKSKGKNRNFQNINAEVSLPDSMDDFEKMLTSCQRQLLKTDLWKHLNRTCSPEDLHEIVCYGIGNFYTRRQSAPLWQLAMALLLSSGGKVREPTIVEAPENIEDTAAVQRIVSSNIIQIYNFDPVMTEMENKVLQRYEVSVLKENDRACRTVDTSKNETKRTLFFMPHCGVSLYTNLLFTNWNHLHHIIIFGNSLQAYLDQCGDKGESTTVSKQSHDVLKVLQPHWTEMPLESNKSDNALHQFENAFNNSGIVTFANNNEEGEGGDRQEESKKSWQDPPQNYDTTMTDTSGEVL